MKKTKTIFQSYLILGSEDKTTKETEKIANNLNIRIFKNSPDFQIIAPDPKNEGPNHNQAKSKMISIDQIRELKRLIFQKPISQKYKFVIIKKAHTLTVEAQNALLKILEEPPKSAIIILEAHNKSGLLPTILSRVVIIPTHIKNSNKATKRILDNSDTVSLLEEIASVNDPLSWLDNQIISYHNLLTTNIIKHQLNDSPAKITSIIEKCIEAKKMIEANVNPKFVLFNLALQLNTLPPLRPQGRAPDRRSEASHKS